MVPWFVSHANMPLLHGDPVYRPFYWALPVRTGGGGVTVTVPRLHVAGREGRIVAPKKPSTELRQAQAISAVSSLHWYVTVRDSSRVCGDHGWGGLCAERLK